MDMFDEELKQVMGYRNDDGEAPAEMPVMERKAAPKKSQSEPVDAQYVPFPKAERGLMARLKDMSVWLGICGGISMLMWWFEVNGLMAMEAAYPCILASAVIGGVGIGRSSK